MIRDLDADIAVFGKGVEDHFEFDKIIVEAWGDLHMVQTDFGNDLQPNRFPNAVGFFVPAAERFLQPGLFAAGLNRFFPVFAADDQRGFPVGSAEFIRDVEAETGIPTLMIPHEMPVDVHLGFVIRAFEMEDDATVLEGFWIHFDIPPIPNDGVLIGDRKPARGGLVRKRNADPHPAGE